jgi:hypothetical protein
MRYLGLVYPRLKDNQRIQMAALAEMVSRVLKRQLRYKLRMFLKMQGPSLGTLPSQCAYCRYSFYDSEFVIFIDFTTQPQLQVVAQLPFFFSLIRSIRLIM